MNNQHLTAADRGAIEILLRDNFNKSAIAKKLGRDTSVISIEINNRSTPNGYFADIAQLDYETKRRRCRKHRKIETGSLMGFIESRLRLGWSPEQISGRMRLQNYPIQVCHETIYRFIYDSAYGKENKLSQYLRLGRKKRRQQNGRKVHTQRIPNRVSIHQRPKVVDERVQLGHWEGDSVLYLNKKAINTLNELMSGKIKLTKLDRKTALLTNKAIENISKECEIKTLTVDNEPEFSGHEELSERTGIEVYFADPYSSWQRGSNENGNGLLRRYLPKRSSIDDLTQEELDDIAEELNNRPRKRLGYRTPNEVYLLNLNKSKTCCSCN